MTLSGDSQNASQELVLASLGSGVRGEVKRIDTHASIVFLEPDRVLKIKRAVRLPFLDFSTLEKRKLACKEENCRQQTPRAKYLPPRGTHYAKRRRTRNRWQRTRDRMGRRDGAL